MTAVRLRQAAQAVDDAYAERDAAIADALEQGWTQRAVAAAVGLSYGRVGQIAQAQGRTEVRYVRHRD